MILNDINLGSFIADLMVGYNNLIEADNLKISNVEKNFESLNVKQLLIDDAINNLGTSLSNFEPDVIKSLIDTLCFHNASIMNKYKSSINEVIAKTAKEHKFTAKDMVSSYSAREFAKLLGVSEITIQRKLSSGDIKAIKFGRSWRIDQNELKLINIGFTRKTSKEILELCQNDTKENKLTFLNYINTLTSIYNSPIRLELFKNEKLIQINEQIDLYKHLTSDGEIKEFIVDDYCYFIDNCLKELKGKVYKDR